MKPKPFECDCLHLYTPPHPVGAVLHTSSAHMRRKLERMLGPSSAAQWTLYGEEATLQLERLHSGLSYTERAELRVAPLFETGPDLWQAMTLEDWLERQRSAWFGALEDKLYFELQPIAHLRTRQTYGFEALVRARLNDGQHLNAGALLSAARSYSQTHAFDAVARVGAIEQAFPHLPAPYSLFVNFAPSVVYDPQVCLATTLKACERVGADPSRLVFEVVETEAFPDLELLGRILERYRDFGARVALDDLGAGNTSLMYLERLRPDLVKLDRDLIRGIHFDDPRSKLVAALIDYAHRLGIEVVAEGVETAAEFKTVLELGADYAQGYFLGRPERIARPISLQTWSTLE